MSVSKHEVGVAGRLVSVVLVVSAGAACDLNKPHATAEETGPKVESLPAEPERAPSPAERMQGAHTLSAAIGIAKTEMTDRPNDAGLGTIMLLGWATKSMSWSDVGVTTDETSYALVMKDAEEERGKRLCVPGNIIQISVDKLDSAKVHEGLLMSDAGNLYRFYGVRSSGTLVQKHRARFCGVVTGRYDYSNSAGGTGHAVKLVGMFDLPENRS